MIGFEVFLKEIMLNHKVKYYLSVFLVEYADSAVYTIIHYYILHFMDLFSIYFSVNLLIEVKIALYNIDTVFVSICIY